MCAISRRRLGYTKIGSSVQYLGIEAEDALEMSGRRSLP
jgi:hypothetical protein